MDSEILGLSKTSIDETVFPKMMFSVPASRTCRAGWHSEGQSAMLAASGLTLILRPRRETTSTGKIRGAKGIEAQMTVGMGSYEIYVKRRRLRAAG